jgi:ferredoxin
MRWPGSIEPRTPAWRPDALRWLATGLGGLDRIFDRLYGSRYNPLYRTGTLAALLLTLALVSGTYLLFVYEIGRPYESMRAIQDDVLLGRWMRALHRYASDGAVVAVLLHVVRMLVQGKTWGARVLAWVTGIVLTGMMLLSAFTGFVLVWDAFGQRVAMIGARMLRVIPIFVEPPDRAFVGDRPVPAQFFFMNLFLHVAVPLGMIGFLWLHTSRLARAAWFPESRVLWTTVAAFVVLAIAWPAPLAGPADLLALPGRTPTDWFYGFWLTLADGWPALGVAVTAVAATFMLAMPWMLRPRAAARRAPAAADPDRCEGCRQCFVDCPYDAITMVEGKRPETFPLRADVVADLCVGCGLCIGSCASLAIGPGGHTASQQLAVARQVVADLPDAASRTVVLACRNNGDMTARLRAWAGAPARLACLDVDCAGSVHPGTLSYLASRVDRVLVLACPPQNCLYREGAALGDARVLSDRRPAVPGRLQGQHVEIVHHAPGEWPRVVAGLAAQGDGRAARADARGALLRGAGAVAMTALVLGVTALLSGWPQGRDADHAVLRLGWRLAGQAAQSCRDLTPDEIARRPVHMRVARECTPVALAYDLTAAVDGTVLARKRVRPAGLRGDRPLTVEEDLRVAPGEHRIAVRFAPADPGHDGRILTFERNVRFEPRRVALITTTNDQTLVLR